MSSSLLRLAICLVPAFAVMALSQERQPAAPPAATGKPLGKQFPPRQPFCYGVDFDAAHLEQHPDQQTVSVRVSRGPAEIAAYAEAGKPKKWPEGANIAIAAKTRESDEVQSEYTCSAEGEQWRCISAASADAACEMLTKEVVLRKGDGDTIMLANPSDGLPSLELCSRLDIHETGDELFQLKPMRLSACGQ